MPSSRNPPPGTPFLRPQRLRAYFSKDQEFHKLLTSFNIIGQYASFDLLKKQEPKEAARLGIK